VTRIEGEIVIERPVEQVFDFVVDERNEPRYDSRLLRAEQTSTGPIGRGTRFRAETTMMGRTVGMNTRDPEQRTRDPRARTSRSPRVHAPYWVEHHREKDANPAAEPHPAAPSR